jgi:hypothetical protein
MPPKSQSAKVPAEQFPKSDCCFRKPQFLSAKALPTPYYCQPAIPSTLLSSATKRPAEPSPADWGVAATGVIQWTSDTLIQQGQGTNRSTTIVRAREGQCSASLRLRVLLSKAAKLSSNDCELRATPTRCQPPSKYTFCQFHGRISHREPEHHTASSRTRPFLHQIIQPRGVLFLPILDNTGPSTGVLVCIPIPPLSSRIRFTINSHDTQYHRMKHDAHSLGYTNPHLRNPILHEAATPDEIDRSR